MEEERTSAILLNPSSGDREFDALIDGYGLEIEAGEEEGGSSAGGFDQDCG